MTLTDGYDKPFPPFPFVTTCSSACVTTFCSKIGEHAIAACYVIMFYTMSSQTCYMTLLKHEMMKYSLDMEYLSHLVIATFIFSYLLHQ